MRPSGLSPDQLLGGNIVLDHRGEGRDRNAKADRAGGKVDVVDVLGARRIGLHTAEPAEVLHFLAGLVAHQILNRMKDGRGVRLDRDPVLRPQHGKIERGHDRHHRSGTCLVSADLDAVLFRTDVIGVMDHPVRQPQQPLLDGLQVVSAHAAPFPLHRFLNASI